MSDDMNGKEVTSQELEDRKIEVLDDGSVQVTEVIKTIYKQNYRGFLSDVRNMENYKVQLEDTLKEEFKIKQQDRINKLVEEVNKLKPFIESSEKNFIANQEFIRVRDMSDRLRAELKKQDSDINLNYIGAVWDNIKENEQKVLDYLTDEEKVRFKELKLKALRKSKR